MRRSDPLAEFLSELRRQLPASAPGKRRLLKESEEHLDYAVAELTASGLSPADAQRIAIERFGSPASFARQAGYPTAAAASPGFVRANGEKLDGAMAHTAPRSRNYPPLVLAGLVTLVLLAALPSALTLPEANPSQTLEYAPLPPDQESGAPPASPGNLGSLSLAGSGPAGGDAVAATGSASEGGSLPAASGKNPSTKRCVGTPPRQTEDPLSPPCVAYYSGDNGGATYRGVTRDEVRVLVYFEGCRTDNGTREELPCDTYIDFAQPPTDDENVYARSVRAYQAHFNNRYQTYGRFVHFWAYFDAGFGSSGYTAEVRRANAADNFHKIRPFAAMVGNAFGFVHDWEQVLLERGVLVFKNAQTERAECCTSQAAFSRYKPLLWSVAASAEAYTRIFTGAVCAQVVGRPTTYSGMPTDNGRPRALGIILQSRSGYAGEALHAELSKAQIEACGGQFVAEAVNTGICDNADSAAAAMAAFRQQGVTTIVWPGGPSPAAADCGGLNYTNAAAGIGYYPEVVVSGNGASEITINSQLLNQQFWRNSMLITPFTRADISTERPCYQSAREADPEAATTDVENIACSLYDMFRLLFTGIQVAGPRLGPPTVDTGFHAIPAVSSPDPRVPACFFGPGDYTCVKDAMVQWWDPSGQDPGSSTRGCMRMVEGGRRYLAERFPSRDIAHARRANDPCNRQGLLVG